MSKSNIMAGVTSCAFHLVLLAVFCVAAAPRHPSMKAGSQAGTLEVQLLPADGHETAQAEASPEKVVIAPLSSQPPPLVAIGASEPSEPAPPPVESGSAGSASAAAPAFASYASTPSYTEYRHRLLDHIRPYQYYPAEGRAQRMGGIAEVGFAVQRDGTVREIWVEASSGHAELDAAAVDTVRRSQPLPFIPASLPDAMDVLLPIGFTPPARLDHG